MAKQKVPLAKQAAQEFLAKVDPSLIDAVDGFLQEHGPDDPITIAATMMALACMYACGDEIEETERDKNALILPLTTAVCCEAVVEAARLGKLRGFFN